MCIRDSDYSHIDVCIRGEGEEPFKQILLGKELHTIKGVHTKSLQLGHSERIEDLDDIPSPYTNGIFDNLIEKHKDKKMNNLNQMEQLADDVMNVLSVCGMKYYQQLKGKFKDETD